MIAGIDNNKNVNNIVNELFIRGRKLNFYLAFLSKDVRLKTTHFFILKIPNKTELERLAFNHSSHMDFKDFMNLDKKWTANHIFFSYWWYSCIR